MVRISREERRRSNPDSGYVWMSDEPHGSSGLMRVRPNDSEYIELAEAEAGFWQKIQMYSLESVEKVQADGPYERYVNGRLTGNSKVSWEMTISRYGDFRRGLVLGMGAPSAEERILRHNPDLHLTLVDISEGPLQRHHRFLTRKYPGRVETRLADLNFIELDSCTYDLIVSSGTIHHVLNLEYLASQINQALTDHGWFFLEDYVGEPRWQFSDVKRRIFQAIITRQMERERTSPELVWESDETLSPCCGVRSNETLDVLPRFLHQQELRTAGALLGPRMRSKCAAPPPVRWNLRLVAYLFRNRVRRLVGARKERFLNQRHIDELTLVSDILEDAGVIKPTVAFAIYRKRLPLETSTR
jgi:SAM-dependent methyltransferase